MGPLNLLLCAAKRDVSIHDLLGLNFTSACCTYNEPTSVFLHFLQFPVDNLVPLHTFPKYLLTPIFRDVMGTTIINTYTTAPYALKSHPFQSSRDCNITMTRVQLTVFYI